MTHKIRWTAKKIARRLRLIEPLVYQLQQSLPPFRYTALAGPLEPPPVGLDVDDGDWPVVEAYSYWGEFMTDFALRSQFQVPAEWNSSAPVALYLPLGNAGDFSHPEALAYIDGEPYATCDRHHQEILLPRQWCDGRSHLLALHGWTGLGLGEGLETLGLGPGKKLFMRPCTMVQIDQPTRDFVATARVALGAAECLGDNEPAKGHLLNALDEAFKILDTREPLGEHFYNSVGRATAALMAGIEQAGRPLDASLVATGHAHIDVAWLWTLGQTRRKAGRTFYNVLRLMEQFPEYHFTQSQPQLYEFVRQDYPGLLEAIRERVAEGRWEPIGGMWVEADCNLSGPESLARQFLLGRRFFQKHFGPGAESPVLWLPDVFGYAWNLPQLIKEAGLEYFFTIKIGWNQYNRLPYSSFWWQGLDGTRVLTHFSTNPDPGSYGASTYNAGATPAEVVGSWSMSQQKELHQESLMAFGFGDGGGGPTREMLENLREMAAFPAVPRVYQRPVADFFRDLETQAGGRLPTWNGELYLELHRGTYTTQSRNKRANRKSEFLLHDTEFLAVLATLLDSTYDYPAEMLRQAWQLVCLNQFHDIIPGSSITPVYAESQQQYTEVRNLCATVQDSARAVIAGQVGDGLLVINPTSFTRQDLVLCLPDVAGEQLRLQHPDGTMVPVQPGADGTWLDVGQVPAFSITPLKRANGETPQADTGLRVTSTLLENDTLRVELDQVGDITRIYDKANRREVLPAGAIANQVQAFEDRPLDWDAWDVDIFYDDKMWLAEPADSVEVLEAGPLRATLEIRRRILHSAYVQRISLAYNSSRLDFETTIEWRERHIFLKVAFPVEILAPAATYEIQWGNVQRPAHRNTSWDWARFETCAQKWVDLSEGNYGVSLLNDCKYGHDIHDNVMRISLLRSPTMPDPEADQGEHRFAYSLLPHAGAWDETTVAAAYTLNDPLMVIASQAGQSAEKQPDGAPAMAGGQSLLSVDRPNIVIETVKMAEDGQGVIVRLYESQRQRGLVTLAAGFELGAAWRTNLLEENQAALTPEGNRLTFSVRPFEIVTLRLIPTGKR
ncbi:MAG: alpha-mannosidase [Chloroflexi bacterium]|nr:alpha-mannosidase [Chloroflexota bacterium]MCI0578965.1 alpha-mannosidase [Chloroflexota bacterium]MCI0645097.1 alpha-mannosidase [Chloroflexota bacterium]MCI0731932.1 alpha-mannosidase [Chloroflexota bacterium]